MGLSEMFNIGDVSQRHTYDKKAHLLNIYLDNLEKDSEYTYLEVEGIDEHKYRGDFYGLLVSLNLPEHIHLPMLILNGLKSSDSYHKPLNKLKYPSKIVYARLSEFIDRIPQNKL